MAKTLKKRTERGGASGDTIEGEDFVVGKVYADGVYRLDRTPPAPVLTTYTLTVNGGTNGTFLGKEGAGPEAFAVTNVPAGQEIDSFPTIAGVRLVSRESGLITVDRTAGAGDLDIPGVTFKAIATEATASATDFIHVVAGANQTTGLSVGSPVLFSTPTIHNSIGCTFSNGVFSLPANKTFRLEAQITYAAGTEVIYRWRNITTGDLVGSAGNAIVGGRGLIASAMVTTTQPTTVRLEITQVNGLTSINANDTYSRNSWAYIKEIDRIVFSAPTGTTLFTPRAITGTGITTAQGRDNTVSTVRITGITAGSEILQGDITASGGATVDVVDSGRSGTATINVVPNGADVAITYTQTVWRWTATAVNAPGGAVVNVDNNTSKAINGTIAQSVALTVPSGSYLSGVTATGANITGFTRSGNVTFIPSNSSNVVLTATFDSTETASHYAFANVGVDVTLGNYKIRLATGTKSMQISTVSGTVTLSGESSYYGPTGFGFAAVNNLSVSTTPTYVNSSWGFGNASDTQRFAFKDGGGGIYEFLLHIGSGYNNNGFTMTRLR